MNTLGVIVFNFFKNNPVHTSVWWSLIAQNHVNKCKIREAEIHLILVSNPYKGIPSINEKKILYIKLKHTSLFYLLMYLVCIMYLDIMGNITCKHKVLQANTKDSQIQFNVNAKLQFTPSEMINQGKNK